MSDTHDGTTLTLGGDSPVHRLGFGAMRLTDWDSSIDSRVSVAIARRAVELGVTYIDTADSYDVGANEELLAEALHPYSRDLVIGTKAGQCRPDRDSWIPLGRPEYLRQQAELSLRRLRTDCLDLFQLHRVDPTVPFDEQVGVLADIRREGKARMIGLSEVSVDELERARRITDIATVQNGYNLDDRRHEAVVDYCEAHGIAFMAWKPLNYAVPRHPGSAILAVAEELDATATQVALAWLLARSRVIIPIPGTSSIDHLEQNWAASNLRLSSAQFAALSAAS